MIRIIGMLLLLAALGQVMSSSSPAAQVARLCRVEGVVVDATTGQPLHKISLYLDGRGRPALENGVRVSPPSYITVSDAAGHFAFTSVPPGRYTLKADGNGYVSDQFYGARDRYGFGKVLTLAAGDTLKNLEFRLEPAVVIMGRIVDEDGDPLENVQVTVLIRANEMPAQYVQAGSGATNDLGEYRIFGLRPGHCYVFAFPTNQTRENTEREISSPEFYPGTSDPSQATPIDTNPGDVVSGIDLTLVPAKPASLSGQVTNGATGKPANAGFFVMLNAVAEPGTNGLSSQYMYGANVDDLGRFKIANIPPGSYILWASDNEGRAHLYAEAPVDLSLGETLNDVELTLTRALELSGRVSADPSPALKLQSLAVNPEADPSNPPAAQLDGGGVNADGMFTLQNIPPGKYRIRVENLPPQYYLKSATLDGADVLEHGFTLTAGSAPGKLALFLSLDGGTVTGTVLGNDKPVVGATVALVPDPPRRDRDDLYRSAQTDSMGRFTMPGLAPGDYKLFAWKNLQGHDFKDPEFIRLFEHRGKDVEVQLRQQQNVQLEVIPAEGMPPQ